MKRILSMFLAIAMMVTLLPTAVAAASEAPFELVAGISGDTVTLKLNTTEAFEYTSLDASVKVPEGCKIQSIAQGADYSAMAAGNQVLNATAGTASIIAADTDAATNVAANKEILVMTVDASQATATTLTFSVTFTGAYADIDSNSHTWAGATVTSNEVTKTAAPTTDYTATLSSTTTTVDNNGTDKVSVNVVVGGTTGSFASTEIKLTYDPAYLTYSTGSCVLTPSLEDGQTDQAVSISAENGVVTIRDYGGNMTVDANGTTAYTLVFDTVKGGNTNVSLISAGFSTQDNAASENLSYVTDTSSSVAVTINHKATVTVDGTAGDTTYVAPNGNYTYQISDYNATKYTYTVTATEGSGDTASAVDSARISIGNDGKVTITGVTGELAVTIQKTANTFNIKWTDTDSAITSTKPDTWNYDTDVTFTVMAGSQADNSTADGYYYSVKAYLTNDQNKTALTYTSNSTDKYAEQTYTINKAVITGDITIEVTKVEEKATDATITIDNENIDFSELKINGADVTGTQVIVSKNQEVTVTVIEEDGYTYKVETIVGETTTELTKNENGVYTFTPSEALTLKVTKTLDTTSLNVTEYVQLDGKTMWLVKIGSAQITGKTYTYKASEEATAENFFWSSKYNAYCYLIITDTNTDANAVKDNLAGKIGLTGTAAVAIIYNGNVNLTTNNSTAVIDVNDAQLVWNMYSAVYSGFDTNVTVQKFLEADMDGTGELSTNDAALVVAAIPAN